MKRYILILICSAALIMPGAVTPLRAQSASCTCNCLKPLFDYLIASNRLFIPQSDHVILSSLLTDARKAGYDVSFMECAILRKNISNEFYALTTDVSGTLYKARIGDCEVLLQATSGAVNFTQLQSSGCNNDAVTYHLAGSSGTVAQLATGNCYTSQVIPSGICYSAVTDTSVNVYTYGVAGNWRPLRAYSYYSDRTENSTGTAVDLRSGGTIAGFVPFWQNNNGNWVANQDTTKWVWNSETTLFNRKGLEMETMDPLGRFTAGLYGYDDALMVATVQNGRFRESAFEGFEDYFFGGNSCDAGVCSSGRSFDFSAYTGQLDTTQQHTGKYSLRVDGNKTISLSAVVAAADTSDFNLTFTTGTVNCLIGYSGPILESVTTGHNALLPSFSPLAGKQLLISAWVKEAQACQGDTYTNNKISIVIKGATDSTSVIATPKGGIIEGWQRYEQVVNLPAGTTVFAINLQATGSTAVYFDDIRIHPFNAYMKSFVYNPQNLRLMAELDENNYATFFEYDDEGTLIRQKKETERGIKTITETRSALLKP